MLQIKYMLSRIIFTPRCTSQHLPGVFQQRLPWIPPTTVTGAARLTRGRSAQRQTLCSRTINTLLLPLPLPGRVPELRSHPQAPPAAESGAQPGAEQEPSPWDYPYRPLARQSPRSLGPHKPAPHRPLLHAVSSHRCPGGANWGAGPSAAAHFRRRAPARFRVAAGMEGDRTFTFCY